MVLRVFPYSFNQYSLYLLLQERVWNHPSFSGIMQNIKNSILRHLRVGISSRQCFFVKDRDAAFSRLRRHMCASTCNSSNELIDRVIGLVKKFDRIDAAMVTETADFQKDLCLDSLDRVELVMAFEQEFSIEIPDEVADKLTCCADVAKHIATSGAEGKVMENS